jgi:hypothetical protein
MTKQSSTIKIMVYRLVMVKILKMETTGSSKMLVPIYQTIQRLIRDVRNLNTLQCENFISRTGPNKLSLLLHDFMNCYKMSKRFRMVKRLSA